MKIIKYLPLLLVIVACSSTPSIRTYFVEAGVVQLFVPPTDWTAKSTKIKAQLDITYRVGTDIPPAVNISFFGGKTIPRQITSISLNGSGHSCVFENITVLYPNMKKKEVRITSTANRDDLLSVLAADRVILAAEIDGIPHQFIPDKNFQILKNEFLTSISYY